ncbi:Estradiol 17-beta-dehydrogenase 11 [Varanus komodoensis]|uniref:Estradiol 17-beta-dehydrogenase 11 n=1 Tax=Varanus komodoensis TaxID=61221 RepID=A0A8D2L2G3_VARKO|nr:estradiol 17-beta-dehydrogenase 11-like [Varanus komodoensis]XP_044284733.1 estradiol 17-beta-dehydrogenase 11-like [Varanus komodoensis]KAF7252822.1 Estradiol 17-beta-dehydrogenase 11 [Varanus komodoensis]
MNLLLEFLWLIVIIIYSYVEALVKLFIPVKRKSVRGEIVLITGAAHGIGRLTAYEFAKHQSKLVLWDLNKKGLEETAEGCKQLGAEVHAFRVDCSVKEEIYSAAEKVKREIGDVSILVNNAGVVAAADFLSTLDKQIEKMFQVNILAHHWTVKAFLPAMVENNHGHIVTVASAGGHVTVPFLVSYCSSKFAAVGFHKSLSQELSVLGKDGIKTSCLCPVFINTGFIKHPSSRILPVLEPDRVAKKLMDGILCNQKMIFLPPSLTTALLLERILPERVLLAVDKIINVKFEAILGCERKEQ